jgi:tetratricopeptide (TPR) repeat protein
MVNPVIVALLLQFVAVPPRTILENPAVGTPVPKKVQKDYDKLWILFIRGADDAKLIKDSDKVLKKNRDLFQLVIVQAYVDLYAKRIPDAEKKFELVLKSQPKNRIALSQLAELALAREEYARANDLYTRLLEADPGRSDLETKRQKALLLATENLIRSAAKAEQENREAEAETFYRQALSIAPHEPSLLGRLAGLYAKQKKWEQALETYKLEREFGGPVDEADRNIAQALANLGRAEEARAIVERLKQSGNAEDALEIKVNELEDLGRWGNDVAVFHAIKSATELTRQQLAAVIVRYFPQLTEFRRSTQVVTDIQDAWARPEIQTVVGVGILDALPNHTFQPEAVINRGELALALGRLSRVLSVPPTTAPPVPLTDVGPSSAIYPEIEMVVNQGLMTPDDSGSFNTNTAVSGEDGVRAMQRLLDLLRGKRGY